MKLFISYFVINLKSKLEYKASFILMIISQFLIVLFEAIGIYFLFQRFGLLNGYDLYTILLTFSIIYLGYSLSDLFFRGFDQFSKFIVKGNLDILLVRPRNIYLQILGTEFAIERGSRLILPIITLVIAIVKGSIILSGMKIITLILAVFGSFALFAAVSIISAAFTFKSVEGLEIINILQHGTRNFGQYPMKIFPKAIFIVFTFLFPLTSINYFPVRYIIGETSSLFDALSPLLTLIFLLFSIFLFNLGLKKYHSTGS